MNQPVIKVQNLGKRYHIQHQRAGMRYVALRDVLTDKFKKMGNPFQNKSGSGSPDREDFWALREVGFEINSGDKVGVIGRNGAGKSTLLKLLSRITEPTEGRIEIKGRVASLLEVGTGFHPELTGRENIFLNGAILGMGRHEIKRKFDEIVAFSEVEKFLDTPVKRYSSGMYVRLAFSVAAHLEPEILLVDEVLAVGDAQFQKKCLGKMDEVSKQQGRTILFVSHNMAAIKSLCSRAVWLENGRVRKNGAAGQIIEEYLAFFSTPGKNTDIARQKRESKCTLRAKITNLVVMSGGTPNPEFIESKGTATIRLTVQSSAPIRCSAQLIIADEFQPISLIDSGTMHGKMYNLPEGESEIECRVGPLNLYGGKYKIKCGLTVPGQEVIDFVEDAYEFNIREYDPYDSGYNLQKHFGFGLVNIPHEWQ